LPKQIIATKNVIEGYIAKYKIMPTTLILGASVKPERYSYRAAQRLLEAGHNIIMIGARNGMLFEQPIHDTWLVTEEVDTVTMYLSSGHQLAYQQKILALKPRRVIFNPGSENAEFEIMLH